MANYKWRVGKKKGKKKDFSLKSSSNWEAYREQKAQLLQVKENFIFEWKMSVWTCSIQ